MSASERFSCSSSDANALLTRAEWSGKSPSTSSAPVAVSSMISERRSCASAGA